MGDAGTGLTGHADAERDATNDATLITQSMHAPERFAVLFDRHAAAIHRYIARRLGPDAADDLVAEAFLVAFQRREAYDAANADARPWLYGIATNLIRRRHRDEIRLLRAIARARENPATEPMADQVAGRVAAWAVRRQLVSALGRLPRSQRDVLLLVATGLSHEETAVALGVPLGTVASRLARARRKVRAELGGVNPIEAPGG
jgi:RNA polymerase sigma-70 factor (ECF subfamily)